MEMQQVMIALVGFLHNLFTAVWVGGLAFISLSLLPSVKKVIGKSKEAKKLMMAVTRHQRIYVYVCIIGLFITGALMVKGIPQYSGFMRFDSPSQILASIKHILTFVMVAIAVMRSVVFGSKKQKDMPEHALGAPMIVVNFVLGVCVLFISSLMAAI